MNKFKELSNTKRVLKCQLTKLSNKITATILDADNVAIEQFKSNITELKIELKKVFSALVNLCENDDEVDSYINESNDVYDQLEELTLKLGRNTCKISSSSKLMSDCTEVKLPKLSIPVFSGNMEEWLSFADLFQASVINNTKLSPGQKLQYLKGCLADKALRIVQSLNITDANFQIAWNLLCERYCNRRELVFSLLKRIINLPMLHSDNYDQLLSTVDVVKEVIRSLENMKYTIEGVADTVFVFLIQTKLDSVTNSWWERSLEGDSIPTVDQLLKFLMVQARCVHADNSVQKKHTPRFSTLVSEIKLKCPICQNNHQLFKCRVFQNLSTQERIKFVKSHNLCFNCLSQNHRVNACESKNQCQVCGMHHHSLLHYENRSSPRRFARNSISAHATSSHPTREIFESSSELQSQETVTTEPPSSSFQHVSSCLSEFGMKHQVLLCTALIAVRDTSGEIQYCRALLDPGSQASFVTEDCVHRLGIPKRKAKVQVSCLGSGGTQTNGVVEVNFSPHFLHEHIFSTPAFVIKNIIGNLPHFNVGIHFHRLFNNLQLADPHFHKSSSIDILLGVDISLPMFLGESISKGEGVPFATNSKLGWIVSGTVSCVTHESPRIVVNNIQCETEELMKKFWEMEEINYEKILSSEEQACEKHFQSTHSRSEDGRYMVRLPFKESTTRLGQSKQQATQQFKRSEKTFVSSPDLLMEYTTFMNEYRDLKHMEKLSAGDVLNHPSNSYYLPHHAVFKASSSTTKIRVVFNASSKTSSGVSLNDILMVGPRMQQELFPILLRFRMFPIAICADIEKMYRQIRVHPEDANYQRILWRDRADQPLEEYRLLTVTYGTASAPYLATRVLQQLALDEKANYPGASRILLSDFYVDDLLSGSETEREAIDLVQQLLNLMNKGGFVLRKWLSNVPSVLQCVPKSLKEDNQQINISSDQLRKILGVSWNPVSDTFHFAVATNEMTVVTKRTILSEIAKIFDPMGWLAPCVVFAKILLQKLWKCDLSWDEPIGETTDFNWNIFHDELKLVSSIVIPRYAFGSTASQLQLHAFCDSSESAYCAVVFLRSKLPNRVPEVNLLCAKTKVAPLKVQSLPRLELCSALLLANLLQPVMKCLNIPAENCYAWSDSTVTLCWIKSEPSRWHTFVANRVATIQEKIPGVEWNHVRGKENPADCATRGMLPSAYIQCKLWFSGPTWLKGPTPENVGFECPLDEKSVRELSREENISISVGVANIEMELFFQKYSSWIKLCRIIAWCKRFAYNSRNSDKKITGFLTCEELQKSTCTIIKEVQRMQFGDELVCLKASKPVKSSSCIISLYPFLDDDEVIRVGGRLSNAVIPKQQKYPMILPKNHHMSNLIIKYIHESNLHAGPELTLSLSRRTFWIISGRHIVKNVLRQCVVCARYRAKTATQIMADLPSARVVPTKPFTKVGVDYTGPFFIKHRAGRGQKTFKCYVCLYICLTTKAIHLEVVEDMSAKAFLASFKIFISRRGRPSELFSDCGTNFIGASKQLAKEFLRCHKNENVYEFLATENIKWNFNPPAAPHFGGLWEAGVKSMKFHLKRTLGNALLTHAEFTTLITQIEACLNSRPLCPVSNDPNDFDVLTPSHFLIGTSLASLPERKLLDDNITYIDRWQLMQKVFQHFWKRWSTEYLNRLQQRPKWQQPQKELGIGDIVLVKEDNIPPLKWRLGRIIKLYPGSDRKIRVVDIRTANGELRRPIAKLCPLPVY